jgi:hypothetical protein
VSTDHGGIGNGHDGNSIDEENIFFIASQKNGVEVIISKDSTETEIQPPVDCLQNSKSLYFDGHDDKIQIPISDQLKFGAAQDFTIECRIRTSSASDVSIVSNKDWDTGLNPRYVMSFRPSSKRWKVNLGDGSSRIDVEGSIINDNEWHTLSATFDRDGLLKIFDDGHMTGSAAIGNIGNLDTAFPLTIGADGRGRYAYNGYISEIRIFNTIVDATAIASWKCKTLDDAHPNYASLIGYWRLNVDPGNSTIKDSGKFRLDGTLQGATWKDTICEPTTQWVYDYSKTPRTVDVAATALEYLCIPIESSWSFDGIPVGIECEPVTSIMLNSEENGFPYPNPVKNGQLISLPSNSVSDGQEVWLTIWDLSGKIVQKERFKKTNQNQFVLKNMEIGIYELVLGTKNYEMYKGRIQVIE